MVGCVVLLAVPCVGVSPSPCVRVPPSPCVGIGDRWTRPGAVRAVSDLGCGDGSWRACASGVVGPVPRCGHVPWGSSRGDWVGGCGGAGSSGVVCAYLPIRVLVPAVALSPPVPSPLAFPFRSVGGPLVVPCPRVLLALLPCPCGRLPVTLGLSSPLCRGPSLCPYPFWCAGGGVVAWSVRRRWPMPGGK